MENRCLARVLAASPKSVLLLGPRQTGKSTLIKKLKPDLIVNLSNEAEYLRYQADANLLSQTLAAQKPQTVFIDEIQRIPSLLNTIQAIIDDSERAPKFYLSGSSARKLRRGQANLLPGRLFVYYLGGFSAVELDYQIDEHKALVHGLLPEPYLHAERAFCEKFLIDYAATYLTEEIQAEALTRNIGGFARFLAELAQRAGKILDLSKLASSAKVRRSSVIRFIEILEDTLIAERVFCFAETTADVIKHPKVFFFDNGVLSGLTHQFVPVGDARGTMAENLIYSSLRNAAKSRDVRLEIFYFRTRGGLEVDFIIRLSGKVYAIEAKSGTIGERDISALKQFKEYYPTVTQCFAVAVGETLREISGVTVCGVTELVRRVGL